MSRFPDEQDRARGRDPQSEAGEPRRRDPEHEQDRTRPRDSDIDQDQPRRRDPESVPPRSADRDGAPAGDGEARLFASAENDQFRGRWSEIQTNFVDDPRRAVEQADALVGDMTDQIVATFTRNRDDLERQWTAGEDVSTEELRRTLQQYRAFFERLLTL